jgi:hypothetical protein
MQLARDGQWAGALIYRQLTRSRAAAARAEPSRAEPLGHARHHEPPPPHLLRRSACLQSLCDGNPLIRALLSHDDVGSRRAVTWVADGTGWARRRFSRRHAREGTARKRAKMHWTRSRDITDREPDGGALMAKRLPSPSINAS